MIYLHQGAAFVNEKLISRSKKKMEHFMQAKFEDYLRTVYQLEVKASYILSLRQRAVH